MRNDFPKGSLATPDHFPKNAFDTRSDTEERDVGTGVGAEDGDTEGVAEGEDDGLGDVLFTVLVTIVLVMVKIPPITATAIVAIAVHASGLIAFVLNKNLHKKLTLTTVLQIINIKLSVNYLKI